MLFTFSREARVLLASKIDEYGKGAWIGLTVLGFWLFWPLGLAIILFLACSGRLRSWRHEGAPGRWYNAPGSEGGRRHGWSGCGWGGRGRERSSGNAAFDEYRAETLRRLEEEQREFMEYLDRLRQAKDKQEFDQFMAERRRRTESPDAGGGNGPAA
jgi:hypothetical protein